MEQKLISIGGAAKVLGVSIDTIRRWEKSGVITSFRPVPKSKRWFKKEDVEIFLNKKPAAPEIDSIDSARLAQNWVCSTPPPPISPSDYCQTSDVFQARLQHLGKEMSKIPELKEAWPVIIAAAGEIGDNSFNHNLGRWPDVPGCFFSHGGENKRIIIADRGQGLLQTLARVVPELRNHGEALRTAFTEYISGRAPEKRGNGLKFVRDIVYEYPLALTFYTGDSRLEFAKNYPDLIITSSGFSFQGCLAIINFTKFFP
jgi:excisionase family DNA binding protein